MNEDKNINVIRFKRENLYHVDNTTNKQLNALRKQIELLQGENKGLTSARVQSEEARLNAESVVVAQRELISNMQSIIDEKDVTINKLLFTNQVPATEEKEKQEADDD